MIRFEKYADNYYWFVIKSIGRNGILVNGEYLEQEGVRRVQNLKESLVITISNEEDPENEFNIVVKPIVDNIKKAARTMGVLSGKDFIIMEY